MARKPRVGNMGEILGNVEILRLTPFKSFKIIIYFLIVFAAMRLEAEEGPIAVVKEFYCFLISEIDAENGPNIFYSPVEIYRGFLDEYKVVLPSEEDSARVTIWRFAIRNRGMFEFRGVDPTDLWGKIKIGYLFFNFPKNGLFIEGQLYVLVAKPGRLGMWKEVLFPVHRVLEDYGYTYKIDFTGIRVNGQMLDVSGEFGQVTEN